MKWVTGILAVFVVAGFFVSEQSQAESRAPSSLSLQLPPLSPCAEDPFDVIWNGEEYLACLKATATPTPTLTPTPTFTPTPQPTPTPTFTATPIPPTPTPLPPTFTPTPLPPTPTPTPDLNTVIITSGQRIRYSVTVQSNTVYECAPGVVLDGQKVTKVAFSGSGTSNVTIRNCVIENYATDTQRCVIDARGTSGWRIEDNEVRKNKSCGIEGGTESLVTGNHIHHNGQIGVKADSAVDAHFLSNEINHNNCAWQSNTNSACPWPGVNPGFEAGGSKFVDTTRLVVEDNYVHHNKGPGLWTDIDNIDTTYKWNHVTDNCQMGIFHEISYRAWIHDNTLDNNAGGLDGCTGTGWGYGAQILIAHSPDVEAWNNHVIARCQGCDGIVVIQQNRYDHVGKFGPHEARNANVHHNTITLTMLGFQGWAGGATGDFTGADAIVKTGHFDFNTYDVPNVTCTCFNWGFEEVNFSGFRQRGQEINGSIQ